MSNLNLSDLISSSYYDTEPLYNKNQPEFLNSVVKFSTKLKPFDLLDEIQKVERMLGRPKLRGKNQPRIIDIDILFHGNSIIDTKDLSLPHPMISHRKFILIPFVEIEPKFKIPHTNLTINELLDNCLDSSRIEKHHMETQA